MELPVIAFEFQAGDQIAWRVGDPFVTRRQGGEQRRLTDWWAAWRSMGGWSWTLSADDQAVLDLIARAGKFYGPTDAGQQELFTVHLMEHLLCAAQGDEARHTVHLARGGHGPFWYTVWCALRGLPLPEPPKDRGCCYPIAPYGASEECDCCGSAVPARLEPTWPV